MKKFDYFVVFFVFGIFCVLLLSPSRLTTQDDNCFQTSLDKLVEARSKAAEEWLSGAMHHDIIPNYSEMLMAYQALRDSRYSAAKSKEQRVQSLEKYHKNVESIRMALYALKLEDSNLQNELVLRHAKYLEADALVRIAEEQAKK